MARTYDMTSGIYRRIYSSAVRGKRINSVSVFAELLFWRLHCIADDFGTFPADADIIKIDALTRRPDITEEQINDALEELQRANLISLFVHKERYGEILDFAKYQPGRPNGRKIQRYPRNSYGLDSPNGESKTLDSPNGESKTLDSPNGESKTLDSPSGVPKKSCAPQEQEQGHVQEQGVEQEAPPNPPTPGIPTDRADVDAILSEYPLQAALAPARYHVGRALTELRSRAECRDDPVGWLKAKVRLYAQSHEGTKKPVQARYWFSDKRYDDDPAAWNRGSQPAKDEKPAPSSPGALEWNGADYTADEIADMRRQEAERDRLRKLREAELASGGGGK